MNPAKLGSQRALRHGVKAHLMLALLLALLLVLAQQQGFRHAVAHANLVHHDHGPDAPAPAQSSCSDCSSFAVFGAPLPMSDAALAFATPSLATPCCARTWPSTEVAAPAAYDSRAPPTLV